MPWPDIMFRDPQDIADEAQRAARVRRAIVEERARAAAPPSIELGLFLFFLSLGKRL